jgi:hypothetical protein
MADQFRRTKAGPLSCDETRPDQFHKPLLSLRDCCRVFSIERAVDIARRILGDFDIQRVRSIRSLPRRGRVYRWVYAQYWPRLGSRSMLHTLDPPRRTDIVNAKS